MFLSYNDHPTGQFSQSSSYSQTFNSEFCSVEHCIVLGILSFCFVIIFCALLTQRQDSWTSPHKKINDIFQDRERQSHMISLRKKAEMPPVWEMRLKKSKRKVDFTGFTTLINLGVSNPSIQPSKKAEILQRLCSSVYSEHWSGEVRCSNYMKISSQRAVGGYKVLGALPNFLLQIFMFPNFFGDLDLCENIQLCKEVWLQVQVMPARENIHSSKW